MICGTGAQAVATRARPSEAAARAHGRPAASGRRESRGPDGHLLPGGLPVDPAAASPVGIGVEDVHEIAGGFAAQVAAGLPIVSE